MELLRIRHNWPEDAGFELCRAKGATEYVLLHFHGVVEVTFGGSRRATQPGALIVFAPGTPHSFRSQGALLHDWMHLTGDVAHEIAAFGLAVDTLYQPGCGQQITQLTEQLETEFFARRSHWQTQSAALLTQLWVLLSRDLAGETPVPVPRELGEQLRALRAELLLHPEQDWTNERMARRLGISVSRLYPLYRRMFAISPGHDLILMRVEKAKNLLMQGENVSQTAERMGYASTYHFIRQFRQVTGATPGQLRKSASDAVERREGK